MFTYDKARRSLFQTALDVTHRLAMCPVVRDFTPCGCEGFARNAAIRRHICVALTHTPIASSLLADPSRNPQYSRFSTPQTSSRDLIALRDCTVNSLLSVLGSTGMPYSVAASASFTSFCRSLVKLGQRHPEVPIEQLYPALTSSFISARALTESDRLIRRVLEQHSKTAVCIMFDGSRIIHRSLLTISFCALSLKARPLYLQICHQPRDKTEYSEFLKELATDLRTKYHIELASICTDGCPAQVAGVKMYQTWLQTLSPQTGIEPPNVLPIYIPCLNHRINLVTQHLLCSDAISPITEKLRAISSSINTAKLRGIFGKPCPVFITTRWLSACLITSFLRMHRNILLENHLCSTEDINAFIRLEILLTPLMELHLFFESDEMKLCYTFPAIMRTFQQYRNLAYSKHFSGEPYFGIIKRLIVKLFNETIAGYIGELTFLAFIMTPIGKLLTNLHKGLWCYSSELNLHELYSRQSVFVVYAFIVLHLGLR